MNNNYNYSNNNYDTNNMNLFSPSEGYMLGNMFQSEYVPYKNYKPGQLVATNDQQKMYLNLSSLAFAAHDLALYLDVNPNDRNMILKFNEYREAANRALSQYETKYGPLNLSSNALNSYPWVWEELNWPWGGESSV